MNLDFDIIDITFSNGNIDTVIPVVSNPIDVIPEGNPPVYTESDEEPNWWFIVAGVILVVVLIVALPSILVGLIKGVFALIGKILKGFWRFITGDKKG